MMNVRTALKIETIARLHRIAAGTLLGEYGQSALYHLGSALAAYHIPNTIEDDYYGYNREAEIARHVAEAFKIFRRAKYAKAIRKVKHPEPSFSDCRSTECEGAYLRVE